MLPHMQVQGGTHIPPCTCKSAMRAQISQGWCFQKCNSCSSWLDAAYESSAQPLKQQTCCVHLQVLAHPGSVSLMVRRAMTAMSSTVSVTFCRYTSTQERGAGHASSMASSAGAATGAAAAGAGGVLDLAGAAASAFGLAPSLVGVEVFTTTSLFRSGQHCHQQSAREERKQQQQLLMGVC